MSWNLVDHDMWTGYDGDRAVAQVSTEWADGEWRWAACYWGDLPIGSLGVSLGHDPRRQNGTWRTAEEAMAVVDAQA